MKTITYKNAPLVELIVELRWLVQGFGSSGGPHVVNDNSSNFDQWVHCLTTELRKYDFHELERLVPHEIPPIVHQPIFRYKKIDSRFPICQFGHGIFTINSGPPSYISWVEFRPFVAKILKTLIECNPKSPELSFNRVNLRYIDLFNDELRNNQSNFSFIQDTLGVELTLPNDLLDCASDEDSIQPTVTVKLPLARMENSNLVIQIGAGRLGRESGVNTVMDLSCIVEKETNATPDSVLTHLDMAHEVLHSWFEKLTKKIHERMQPVQ